MSKVIVIAGPTATGKTELSLFLAKQLNGEIINADSTQVYKGMDIATAKVEDTKGIKHHLLSFKDINEDYTVCDYQKDARKIIDSLLAQNKTPILVGGTGLYIKAVLYNYNFDNEIKDYSNLGDEELYTRVTKLDVNNKIHPNNRRRLERALSYMESTNKPFSAKEPSEQLLYDTLFIGLEAPRAVLYNYINKRVDKMVDNGLLKESKKIYDSGIRSKAVMTPIGYKELFPYFDGKVSLEEALKLIKQNSRHYAKRQFTWFKNQMQFKWFETNYEDFSKTEKEVLEYIKREN